MLFVGVFFSACLICAIFVLPKILGRIFNKTGRARMARFFWWLVKIALLAVAVCLIFVHPFVAAIWVAVIVGGWIALRHLKLSEERNALIRKSLDNAIGR